MTGATVTNTTLQKLRRVLAISKEQRAENLMLGGGIPMSVVYPSALLLEDVEINVKRIDKKKNSSLIGK